MYISKVKATLAIVIATESKVAADIYCNQFRPNLKQQKVNMLSEIAEQLFILRGGEELLEPACGECKYHNPEVKGCLYPGMEMATIHPETRGCRNFIEKEGTT